MKRWLVIMAMTCLVSACFEKDDSKTAEEVNQTKEAVYLEAPQIDYENQQFEFDAANLNPQCDKTDGIVCVIDLAVKCTLKPQMEICKKAQLPQFIFMEDENLGRPTKMAYKIEKLKAINPDTVEVYTQSSCDGNWFGLCQGNVIYVMGVSEDGGWRVKDVYAIGQ